MPLKDILTGQAKRSTLRDILDANAPAPAAPDVPDAPLEQGITSSLYSSSAGAYAQQKLDAELEGVKNPNADAGYARNILRAQETSPRVQSYRDVHGVGDAVNYGLGQAGQGFATMAPVAAGALAARLIPGSSGLLPYLGAAIPAYQMERGEAVSNQYADPELAAQPAQLRSDQATQKALVNSALESLVPGALGERFLRPGNALRTFGHGLLAEGTTEGLQEVSGVQANEALRHGGDQTAGLTAALDGSHTDQYIDAALAGVLGSGGITAPVAATQALANTGKFGLDQAKKVPGLVQTKADKLAGETLGDKPFDLNSLPLRDHIRKVMEPDPESSRATRPNFVDPAPYDNAKPSPETIQAQMEDHPRRAKAIADRIVEHGDKWAPDDLMAEAIAVGSGHVTDPAQINTFIQKAKKQDFNNTMIAHAQDAARGAGKVSKATFDFLKPLVESGKAKVEDLAHIVKNKINSSGDTKSNLQAPTLQAREDIAQIIFEHLKPEAAAQAKVISALPGMASKLAVLGTLSKVAARDGLTLTQYAQRTASLPKEAVKALDDFKEFFSLTDKPDQLINALKQYGNFDAENMGLPTKSYAQTDSVNPGSTFSASLTDEARKDPQTVKQLAKLIDGVVGRRKFNAGETALMERAFGPRAGLVATMYERQVPLEKPSKERVARVKSDKAAEQQGLTAQGGDSTVNYELDGVDGKTPFKLDDPALHAEIKAEAKNDTRGAGLVVPERSVVPLQSVAEEKFPGEPAKQDKFMMEHAETVLKNIHQPTTGLDPAAAQARVADQKWANHLGLKADTTLTAEHMPAVRKLLEKYGAKRVAAQNSGALGTGPTFRSLHAAGRKGYRSAQKLDKRDPKQQAAKAALEKTFFTYQRQEPGKSKPKIVTISADTLLAHYRRFTFDTSPEKMFHEALGDLMLSDPYAVPGSINIPEGMQLAREGGQPFALESNARPRTEDQQAGYTAAQKDPHIVEARAQLQEAVDEATQHIEQFSDPRRSLDAEREAVGEIIDRLATARNEMSKASFYMHPANKEALNERRKAEKVRRGAKPSKVLELVDWATTKGGSGRSAALREVASEYTKALDILRRERTEALIAAPKEVNEDGELVNATPEKHRELDTAAVAGKASNPLHPRKDDIHQEIRANESAAAQKESRASLAREEAAIQSEVAKAMIDAHNSEFEFPPEVSRKSAKAFKAALAAYHSANGLRKTQLMAGYRNTAAKPFKQLVIAHAQSIKNFQTKQLATKREAERQTGGKGVGPLVTRLAPPAEESLAPELKAAATAASRRQAKIENEAARADYDKDQRKIDADKAEYPDQFLLGEALTAREAAPASVPVKLPNAPSSKYAAKLDEQRAKTAVGLPGSTLDLKSRLKPQTRAEKPASRFAPLVADGRATLRDGVYYVHDADATKNLAGTNREGEIFVNMGKISKDSPGQSLADYISQSPQKMEVMKAIGVTPEQFAAVFKDNRKRIIEYLRDHERDHVKNNDAATYPTKADGSLDLMHQKAIDIELRASLEPLTKEERAQLEPETFFQIAARETAAFKKMSNKELQAEIAEQAALGVDDENNVDARLDTLRRELASRMKSNPAIKFNMMSQHIHDSIGDEGIPVTHDSPHKFDGNFNKQKTTAQKQSVANARAILKLLRTDIARMLGVDGPKIGIALKGMLDGSSGSFDALQNSIKVSLFAGDIQGVGYHEALHAFFNRLSDSPAGRTLRKNLMDAASTPHARKQLAEFLKDHPAALSQIESDPEERAAYMFQIWAVGKSLGKPLMTFSPAALNIFQKIAKYIQAMVGVMTTDERALKVFDALWDGRFADRNTVSEVITDMKLDTVADKLRRVAGPIADAADKLLLVAPDRLRRFGNAPMDTLADLISREPGHEHGGAAFAQAVSQQSAKFKNDIADLFDNSTSEERKIALMNLQAMKAPSTPLEVKTAALLKKVFAYMDEKGVERLDEKTKKWEPLKAVAHYFPRKWDASLIAADEAGFAALLAKHGKVSSKAAREVIEAIKSGDGHLETADDPLHAGFTPFAAAAEARKFEFINPSNAAEFVKFQNKDLGDTLRTYVNQAVHRAEFAERFDNNGDKIKRLMDQGAKHMTPAEVEEAGKIVKAVMGTLGAHMNPQARQVMSSLIALENVILLPMTMFSQFVDAIGVGMRSKDMTEAGSAFFRGLAGIAKDLTGQGPDAETAMARTIGLIDNDNMLEIMGHAQGGEFMSTFARNVTRQFFKWNGMTAWNQSMRVAAMVAGQRFMIREKANGRYMRELGLEEADVLSMPDGHMALTREQFQELQPGMSDAEATAREKKVQTAMFRFVDGAVLRPTSVQRPVWGSDPHFMLLFHLRQYTYSFQKTILARSANEAAHGEYAPAAAMLAYLPITLASIAAKAAFTGVPLGDTSVLALGMRTLQRSGLATPGLNLGLDTLGDLSKGQIPGASSIGPTLQHAVMLGQYAAGDDAITTGAVVRRSVPLAKLFMGDSPVGAASGGK